MVVISAARQRFNVKDTELLWRAHAYSAFKHLLVFCPFEAQAIQQLSLAQESWSRALLGWENQFPGIAAIIDLNWLHISRIASIERCGLLARLKAYPTSTVFNRLQTIMDAAGVLASNWISQSCSIYTAALGSLPPPANGTAWKCLLPYVERDICAADTALRDLSIFTSRNLTWYPFPSPQVQRRSIISSLYDNNGTTPAMQRMFGRIRAGATALPWPNSICPARNNADGGTMHILSSCESTDRCRNLLLQNLLRDVRST